MMLRAHLLSYQFYFGSSGSTIKVIPVLPVIYSCDHGCRSLGCD